jgi:hypothetical protein
LATSSSTRAPVPGSSRLRSRSPAFAVVLICCVALLGGCGGSKAKKVDYTKGPGVSQTLQAATCADWQKGTEFQRRRTVVLLRQFAGGPIGSSKGIQRGPVLNDGRAYKVLQSYCANSFASAFRLYKLYERAAAFVGH